MARKRKKHTEDMSSKRMRVSDPLTNNIRFEEFQSRDILASTKFSPERIGNQVKHVLEPTNTIPRRIVIRPLPDIPEQFLSPTWSTQISQPDSSPFNASDNIQTSPIQLSNISLFPNFMTPTDLNEAMLDNPDMMLMTRSDNCDTFSNISNKKKRKRKKMSFKEDNRLGYKEDLEIFFLWMLYNQNFWECVPESHILNKAVKVSSEKHIPLLVENILKSKTGVELAAVTSETLIGLPRFTELLSDLVSCWNRLSLSHLIEAHCAKPGRNKNAIYYAIDKCIFPIEQVELLMNYVPATEQIFCNINKITNEDEVGDRKSTISGISKTAAYLNLSKDLSSNVHDSQYLKHCKETLSDIYKTGTKDYGKTVNTSAKKILLFDKSRNEHFPKESIKENNISSMEKTLQDFEILSETIDLVMQDQNNAISVTPLDWNLVYCLIKSVMHQVIPIQLVGSKKNFRLLEKAVKILMLCGRNDKFYIGQLMRNIKISDFKWAANLHTFHHRTYVICKLWIWLLRNIVMAVLRSFFYITESSVTRKQLLYYRKREWQKKHDQALAHLVSNGALLNLSRDALRQLTQGVICQSDKSNKLKRPRLRFLPKVQGVRPIMPTRLCGMNTSTKKHAKILLSYLIEKRESGSIRVNASKGMHKVWQSYIRSFKNHTEKESLYFVRVDVKDAYGSILHSQLMKILQEIVAYLPPTITFGQYKIFKQDSKFKKTIYIALDREGRPTQSIITPNGIPLVQCGEQIHIKTNEIVRAIWYSVKQQLIQCGPRQNFILIRGISQGGTLSSALCELYYSSMCSSHLAEFNVFPNMLLRSVDDMLFVTPDLKKARNFLQKMEAGFLDFNCKMNNFKTAHNIDSGEGIRVSFCGVVVCSTSHQLLVNITTLAQGLPRYSVTLNSYRHPGKLFADRLRQVTLARLNTTVLDPVYTTTQGLVCNIWRTGVMAGARLLALVGALLALHGPVNAGFVASVIVQVGGKVWRRVERIWRSIGVTLPLPQAVVLAIYIGAIYKVLTEPHMPAWPGIIRALKYYLSKLLLTIPQRFYYMVPLKSCFKKHFTLK